MTASAITSVVVESIYQCHFDTVESWNMASEEETDVKIVDKKRGK